VGTHNLTAVYNNGDGNFNGSTSNTVTETVRTDVTNQVRFALGKINKKGNKFKQHVDITNIGGTLDGPLAFVLGGLPSKVKLVNATGLAQVQVPGSPFIILSLGSSNQLATNQTNGVDLTFTAKNKGSIRYTPRVFAGPGPV